MPVHLTCPTCGAAFTRKASYVAKHSPVFCTRECHTLSRRNPPIEFSDDGLTGRIALLARDGSVKAYAIIDAADAEWARQHTWGMSMGYAVRRVYKGRTVRDERVYLHRELLGLAVGDAREGDHINRNKLDNRRSNLRIVPDKAAQRQNIPPRAGASSLHRGVSLVKATGMWNARLTVRGRYHHVGQFATEHEAAEAVREARARLMPYAVD